MTWQSNYKTKKAFREAATGKPLRDHAFEPGPHPERQSGNLAIEGPYPYHRWYAVAVTDENGIIRSVK